MKKEQLKGVKPEIKMSINQNDIVDLMYNEKLTELNNLLEDKLLQESKIKESIKNLAIVSFETLKYLKPINDQFKKYKLNVIDIQSDYKNKFWLRLYYTPIDSSFSIEELRVDVKDNIICIKVYELNKTKNIIREEIKNILVEINNFKSSKPAFKAQVIKNLLSKSEEGMQLLKLVKEQPLLLNGKVENM